MPRVSAFASRPVAAREISIAASFADCSCRSWPHSNSRTAKLYHISDFFDRFANVLGDLIVRKAQDTEAAESELIIAVTVIHESTPASVVWEAVKFDHQTARDPQEIDLW